jgi:hypothetical protein
LGSGAVEQVLDWNRASINWAGRGGDRGLRGIAFHAGHVYLAASDEIFVFDRFFQLRDSYTCGYLKHCHEIFIDGGMLYVTSTGFDSVIEFDLERHVFTRGYAVRLGRFQRTARKFGIRPRPSLTVFDPNGKGPVRQDTCHVNNVFVENGDIHVSGTGLGHQFRISRSRLSRYARIPFGSHNARPYRDGVLLNHTPTNRVCFISRRGEVLRAFPIPQYEPEKLLRSDLPGDHARPAFGRGLAVLADDLFIAGSSPATVSVYRFEEVLPIESVNLTMDVRNAIHGLEIWPFD